MEYISLRPWSDLLIDFYYGFVDSRNVGAMIYKYRLYTSLSK